MKLNLGCGSRHLEGFVNIDNRKETNPDKLVDLEKKLPFRDNSIDMVIANHTMEHIENFFGLMGELHRICKSGAIIKIIVPFYASWGFWNDPTHFGKHIRPFSPRTFNYFESGNYYKENLPTDATFKVLKKKLVYCSSGSDIEFMNYIINPIINLSQTIYQKFFAWVIPAEQVHFELEVIK